LVFDLGDVNSVESAEDFADDVVAAVTIETEDDEVEGDVGKLVEVDAVEGEVFVVDWIAGLAEDSSLDFVLLVRKELKFDVGVAGA
jgi:hypothetical protein